MKTKILALLLVASWNQLAAHALVPRCQIQGHVVTADAKAVEVVGIRAGKPSVLARAEPGKDHNYQISFGSTQRHSYEKIRVRLLGNENKVLKEIELGMPVEGKPCANIVDF
jgi:hypothetical protein